jgi:hypothetical protein
MQLLRDGDRETVLGRFADEHARMYRGRLWVNRLARAAVLSPRIASVFVNVARIQPSLLHVLTNKIVRL